MHQSARLDCVYLLQRVAKITFCLINVVNAKSHLEVCARDDLKHLGWTGAACGRTRIGSRRCRRRR